MKEQIFNVKNDEDCHLGEYKTPRRSSNMRHHVFKPYLRILKNLNLDVKHVTNSYSMKRNVEECLSLRVCCVHTLPVKHGRTCCHIQFKQKN
jgi:hypothetical protein